MSFKVYKKADLASALNGSDPDLAAEIVAWLNPLTAVAVGSTEAAPAGGDDDIIIIKH